MCLIVSSLTLTFLSAVLFEPVIFVFSLYVGLVYAIFYLVSRVNLLVR